MAIKLAEQNLRVRVCVQGSMGVPPFTAIPKQLNGVAALLQRMDWGSEAGGENEGMVGDYVNFGGVGKEHVVDSPRPAGGHFASKARSPPPQGAPSARQAENRSTTVAKAGGEAFAEERERPPRQSRRTRASSATQAKDQAEGAKAAEEALAEERKPSDSNTPDTPQDDVFILICPQNMLGKAICSILLPLIL